LKKLRIFAALGITMFLGSSFMVFAEAPSAHRGSEGFSVREYEDFHHVVHELQHDALPKKDFARIRSRAGELFKLGEAIVQLGVPQGTTAANIAEFKKELKKFNAALGQFGADAKAGSDEQLTVSYRAVHDSFETLADMLPRKS
jgi:hypothetical protein